MDLWFWGYERSVELLQLWGLRPWVLLCFTRGYVLQLFANFWIREGAFKFRHPNLQHFQSNKPTVPSLLLVVHFLAWHVGSRIGAFCSRGLKCLPSCILVAPFPTPSTYRLFHLFPGLEKLHSWLVHLVLSVLQFWMANSRIFLFKSFEDLWVCFMY